MILLIKEQLRTELNTMKESNLFIFLSILFISSCKQIDICEYVNSINNSNFNEDYQNLSVIPGANRLPPIIWIKYIDYNCALQIDIRKEFNLSDLDWDNCKSDSSVVLNYIKNKSRYIDFFKKLKSLRILRYENSKSGLEIRVGYDCYNLSCLPDSISERINNLRDGYYQEYDDIQTIFVFPKTRELFNELLLKKHYVRINDNCFLRFTKKYLNRWYDWEDF